MTRSRLGRAAAWASRKRCRSLVIIWTSCRRRSTRAWRRWSSASASGLTKHLCSGCWCSTRAEAADILASSASVLASALMAHAKSRAMRGLTTATARPGSKRARGLELITTGRLQHNQPGVKCGQLVDQFFDASRIVGCLPRRSLRADGYFQRLAGHIDSHENSIEHVRSLPSLFMRTLDSYNRSGCKKGRSNPGAQCSDTGYLFQPRGASGCPSWSEA